MFYVKFAVKRGDILGFYSRRNASFVKFVSDNWLRASKALVVFIVFAGVAGAQAQTPRLKSLTVGAPTPLRPEPGQSATLPITMVRQANNAFTIVLSLNSLPAGITGSLSPSQVSFSAGGGPSNQQRTSTLTINTDPSMLYGTYTFKVRTAVLTAPNDILESLVTIQVGTPKPQTITFNQPADTRYGNSPSSLSATATSGLPVSFSVLNGPASVSGASLTPTGVGTVTVRASQPGTDRWLAADPVDRTLTIVKGLQTLSLTAPEGLRYGMGPVAIQSASSSGLPVGLEVVSGPVTLAGSLMTIGGVGSVTLRATQSGTDLYEPADPVQSTFCIARGSQTINLIVPDPIDAGAGTVTVGATSNVGLPVEVTVSSGPGWIDGRTLHIEGHGTLVLVATQYGSGLYDPAPAVVRVVKVVKRGQDIAFAPLPLRAEEGDVLTLQSSATSGLPVSYRVLSGPAVLEGTKLRLGGRGVVRVIAEQNGNSVYNPAQPVLQTVYVTQEPLMGADDHYMVQSGELLFVEAGGVLENDRDGDIATPSLRFATQNGYIELSTDGSFNYRSRYGFVGTDRFVYKLVTKHNTSEEITVTIEVRA